MSTQASLTLSAMTPEILVSLRKAAKLSQRALAEAAGVSYALVSHLEVARRPFTEENLPPILGALGVAYAGPGAAEADPDTPSKPVAADEPRRAAAIVPASGQTVPFDRLRASTFNPRRAFDPEAITELADSIAAAGILQPILVRPHPDDLTLFEIVVGERRYRAVESLVETGRAFSDYPVPAVVRTDLADDDALALAATENLQRQDLSPMEEARAFDALEPKIGTARIAEITGKSLRFVQQRLSLVRKLDPRAQAALAEGKLPLDAARTMAAAPRAQQAELIGRVDQGWIKGAADVRRYLFDDMPPAGRNLFKLEDYDGAFVEDPDNPEKRYFEDAAQFERLQIAAIEAATRELAETWKWVKVFGTGEFCHGSDWIDAPKADPNDERQGAVIDVRRDLSVVVRTGVFDREAQEKAERAAARKTSGPTGSAKLPAESLVAAHKDHATRRKIYPIQAAVAADPRVAKVLACLAIMGCESIVRVTTVGHVRTDAEALEDTVRARLEQAAQDLTDGAGVPCRMENYRMQPLQAGDGEWTAAHFATDLFDALLALEDPDLDALFAALVAATITGFEYNPRLGDDPLVVAMARHFGIMGNEAAAGLDMTPEDLEGLRRPALEKIAGDLGIPVKDTDKVAAIRDQVAMRAAGTIDPAGYVVPTLRFGDAETIAAAWNGTGENPSADADAAETAERPGGLSPHGDAWFVNDDGIVTDERSGLSLVSLRSILMKIDEAEMDHDPLFGPDAVFAIGETEDDLRRAGYLAAGDALHLAEDGRRHLDWLKTVAIGNGRVTEIYADDAEDPADDEETDPAPAVDTDTPANSMVAAGGDPLDIPPFLQRT